MKKQITVTMTFTENETYPSDDLACLKQNIFTLLNSRLVSDPLFDQVKISTNPKLNKIQSDALLEVKNQEVSMGREMIKSLSIQK